MPKINITTEEKELLKKYFKTSPFLLLRLKSSAILMRDKGLLMKDIADIVSRDRKKRDRSINCVWRILIF